jgi:PDZ domain-containing protein
MVVGGALTTVLFVTSIVAALVRIPYDSVGPGSAKAVNDVVTVNGHEIFPPAGRVYFTTVSVRERVSLLQGLLGWLDPTTDVVPEDQIRGKIPPKKYEELNVQAMTDSKTTAEVLALSRVGFTNLGAGADVRSIADGSPAASVLRAKDVIVEIDGKPVRTTDDAVKAIRAHAPGDVLRLTVTRDGAATPLETTLTQAEDGTARLGVQLSTKVQLPFDIKIDSGDVVGPSAGLAYAIQLLDLLTPGELTGGINVAATGELGPSGAIGAIGGVSQKVITAKRAGAKVFLVPKENEAEARARAGRGLQIVAVSDFDEALVALGSLQGSNAQALARPPRPA